MLHCKIKRTMNGLVRLVMIIPFSLEGMSLNSLCNFTVDLGDFNCLMVTVVENSGGWSSFVLVCCVNNRILGN